MNSVAVLPENFVMAKYNCFVYAFGLVSDPDFIYFGNTPPKYEINSKLVDHLIKYDRLRQVNKIEVETGDYIFYKRGNNYTHAGIVLDGINVISKWGTEDHAIRKHKIEDAYLNFGKDTIFFRRMPSEEIKKQWTK